MIVNIYSIYDSKAQAYLQPFFCATHALAFRNIEKAMKNPHSPFSDFPADFTLFKVGEFDDLEGIVIGVSAHENLGNLIQFAPPPSPVAADTAA